MKLINYVLIFLMSILLFGCSDTPKTLEEKVVARWNFLISGDYTEAYEYLTPGYRQSETLDSYKSRIASSQITWQKSDFEKKECEDENLCVVFVRIEYMYLMPVAGGKEMVQSTTIRENWIKKEDEWYFLPKK